MKVSCEYDQDPRYSWASIDVEGHREPLIVIHCEDGSYGFIFKDGEMLPTCICSARSEYECSCDNMLGRW